MQTDPLDDLLDAIRVDAAHWENKLKTEDTPVVRRAFVRAVFAEIESLLWVMKNDVAESTADPATKAIALDQVFYIDDSGRVLSRTQFGPMKQSIRFAFRALGEASGSHFDLDVQSKEWPMLLSGIETRNRLMHPKSASDLEVSDAEIERIRKAHWWLYAQAAKASQAARKAGEAAVKQLDLQLEAAKQRLAHFESGGT